MKTQQTIGWNAADEKVTGRDASECRNRGAVGVMFDESEEWDAARQEWFTVLRPVSWFPAKLM